MIKVGIFTDNDFGKFNGATTSLRAALEHAPADVALRVYTCSSTGPDLRDHLGSSSEGVGLPYCGETKVYLPPFRRLLRQARADAVDVIHLTTPGPVGLAAIYVASRLQLPLVGSLHTHLAECPSRLLGSKNLGVLLREYLRWPYRRCRRILVPSQATRTVLIAGKMDASTLRLWEGGVSAARFNPTRRSEALRAAWGVSDRRPAVLCVGRLSREKGLGDFEAVQRALTARSIAHRIIFVGDGPMRRELQALFPAAVFTGTLRPEDVAVSMASSDLLVFPSRTDSRGSVVLEAQASGLPVVVTDEGGARDNMMPGRTGVVCGSTRELCRQVLELCVRTASRQRMATTARAYAMGRTWETALAPLYQAYREVGASAGEVGANLAETVGYGLT